MIKFKVPGQPQGKGRAKVTVRGSFAHAYTPEKTASYENLVKLCFRGTLTLSAVRMRVSAFYSIPKSLPKYRRLKALNGELRPTTKPDADNIAKIICDSLNGLAYKDDSQIVEISVSKFYAEEPRVEVEIEEIIL